MLTLTVATTFHVLPIKRGVKLTRSAAGLERTTAIHSVFVHVVEASPPTERESAGQGEVKNNICPIIQKLSCQEHVCHGFVERNISIYLSLCTA